MYKTHVRCWLFRGSQILANWDFPRAKSQSATLWPLVSRNVYIYYFYSLTLGFWSLAKGVLFPELVSIDL